MTNVDHLQANWNYPTDIRFGCGRITELVQVCRELGVEKPLLVTDAALAKLAMVNKVIKELQSNHIACGLFCDVKPNPTGRNIDHGVQTYQQGCHDAVIAFGGGSGLDAGKSIALMVGQSRPLWDFEDIGDNWLRVNTNAIAPLIAIPTTAGTGSEVGRASVIVDEDKQSKKIIFHPLMLPDVVIADPELTKDLPAAITAATGIDAFVHSLEAYLSPGYHPMADGIALEAMSLIKRWLPVAFTRGDDLVARSHMLVASTMGATAFQKGLGGIHALAHPIGALYDKHHGLLNAILAPYVLLRNKTAIEEKCRRIASALELDDPGFNCFFNWFVQFRRQLEIPNDLQSLGINADKKRLIGEMAVKDPSSAGNPIQLDARSYMEIYEHAVVGNLES